MAALDIEDAHGLTEEQLEAIADLERRVVANDGGRLKLEWGSLRERPPDEVSDLLAWDGGTLVGFCGTYWFGGTELAGAVDPSYRRRRIGSALLERAKLLARRRGEPTALLVAPRASDAGARFAQAVGATLHHAEHHMQLDGDPTGPPASRPSTDGLDVRRATGADRSAIIGILESAYGSGAASAVAPGPRDLHLVVTRHGTVVGTLRLSVEGDEAGVYGLAVRTDLRGQGIGRTALYVACREARRRGVRAVTLEVAVDNDHALGLYTSVGFARRTTEDYFEIAV